MEVKKTIKTINGTGEVRASFIGKLDCVIVKLSEDSVIKKCDIIIESSLGYPILFYRDITDTVYISPRKQSTPGGSKMYDATADYHKFNVHEILNITVLGNVIAEIILRS